MRAAARQRRTTARRAAPSAQQPLRGATRSSPALTPRFASTRSAAERAAPAASAASGSRVGLVIAACRAPRERAASIRDVGARLGDAQRNVGGELRARGRARSRRRRSCNCSESARSKRPHPRRRARSAAAAARLSLRCRAAVAREARDLRAERRGHGADERRGRAAAGRGLLRGEGVEQGFDVEGRPRARDRPTSRARDGRQS